MLLLWLFLWGCVSGGVGQSVEEPPPTPVVLVLDECEPYLRYDRRHNTTSGMMTKIWDILMKETKIQVTRQIAMTASEWGEFVNMIKEVALAPQDIPYIFLTCMTITAERSSYMDFTYPFVVENVVLMSIEGVVIPESNILGFISGAMYYILFCICGGIIFYVIEYMWLEETQSMSRITKVVDSVYFSFITASTIGFGDITPKTRIGRVFSIVWISLSVLVISVLTAMFLMALTTHDNAILVDELRKIANEKVGCARDTVFQERWQNSIIHCIPYDSENEMKWLKEGKMKYIIESEFRINQLISENKDLLLVMMTSQLALVTQKKFHNTTQNLNLAIQNNRREIALLEQTLLSAISKGRDLPTVFHMLAADAALFPAVGIMAFLCLFFGVGTLWLRLNPMKLERSIKASRYQSFTVSSGRQYPLALKLEELKKNMVELAESCDDEIVTSNICTKLLQEESEAYTTFAVY
eukprot:PhF_6_TR8621/c0_g1_i1/m.13448